MLELARPLQNISIAWGGMALGQIKETRNTNDMHYIFSTCHMQKVPALQVEMCCMEY